jgi:hypothetical protein
MNFKRLFLIYFFATLGIISAFSACSSEKVAGADEQPNTMAKQSSSSQESTSASRTNDMLASLREFNNRPKPVTISISETGETIEDTVNAQASFDASYQAIVADDSITWINVEENQNLCNSDSCYALTAMLDSEKIVHGPIGFGSTPISKRIVCLNNKNLLYTIGFGDGYVNKTLLKGQSDYPNDSITMEQFKDECSEENGEFYFAVSKTNGRPIEITEKGTVYASKHIDSTGTCRIELVEISADTTFGYRDPYWEKHVKHIFSNCVSELELLWVCSDCESTTSATNIFDFENSHLTKSSSSEKGSSSSKIQSSSSSESSSSSSNESESGSSSSRDLESSSSSSELSSSSVVSSSSVHPVSISSQIPSPTEISPIRTRSLQFYSNADHSVYVLSGMAYIDGFDTTVLIDSDRDPFFTKVEFRLARVNKHGENEEFLLMTQYMPPASSAEAINFDGMDVKIVDTTKTQCGMFKLFLAFYATNDDRDPEKFITVDTVEFVREPMYCQADPIAPVELRLFNGQMKTSTTRGYSFKDEAEVPLAQAQIQVSNSENGVLTLHGVNGYKVTEYDNLKDRTTYDDDWSSTMLPPQPAHMSDFMFTKAKLADSIQNFDIDAFWVVIGPNFNEITGNDFYAVTLSEKGIAYANGVRQLEIIYCKK